MLLLRLSLLAGLFFLGLAGCEKPPSPVATPNQRTTSPTTDACKLITKEEVAGIQGTTIINTKDSTVPNGSFLVSQCYYSSNEPDKSVSLAVNEADPANRAGMEPAKYWEQTFGRYQQDKPETEHEKEAETSKGRKEPAARGEEEKEKVRPPEKIADVGDEAFWAGDRFGGALYVLKRDKGVFLRISVGGPDGQEQKLEKSKALALKALGRL
jgi:hypothetical protein